MRKNITVGIIQHSAVHLDLQQSLEKLESLLSQAYKLGVELAVLGETWLSGYPAWLDYCPEVALWDYKPLKEVYRKFHQNALVVPSKESQFIGELAKKFQMYVVIGVNERVLKGKGNGTIYNSLLTFSPEGNLVNHHRKLMPTYTEKLLYGLGDAEGLKTVAIEDAQLGGLICWEHWMPLTRQVMHNEAEHIHVAVWPKVHEMHQVASRSYAFEGRCYVLAVGQTLQVKDFPKELPLPEQLQNQPEKYILNGGSAIIAPDGKYLLEPVYDQEDILVHQLDLDRVYEEKMTLDVTGHYNRWDIFDFKLKDNPRE